MLSPVGPSEAEVLAGRSNMDMRYKADGVDRKRRMTVLVHKSPFAGLGRATVGRIWPRSPLWTLDALQVQ